MSYRLSLIRCSIHLDSRQGLWLYRHDRWDYIPILIFWCRNTERCCRESHCRSYPPNLRRSLLSLGIAPRIASQTSSSSGPRSWWRHHLRPIRGVLLLAVMDGMYSHTMHGHADSSPTWTPPCPTLPRSYRQRQRTFSSRRKTTEAPGSHCGIPQGYQCSYSPHTHSTRISFYRVQLSPIGHRSGRTSHNIPLPYDPLTADLETIRPLLATPLLFARTLPIVAEELICLAGEASG